jgi:zinc protease
VETSGGLGVVLANLIQQGLSPEEAAAYVQRMESVTPQAASAVAARIASSQRASLVIVGDASKFLDKVKAIRPDVEVIPLADLDLDSPTLRKAR